MGARIATVPYAIYIYLYIYIYIFILYSMVGTPADGGRRTPAGGGQANIPASGRGSGRGGYSTEGAPSGRQGILMRTACIY